MYRFLVSALAAFFVTIPATAESIVAPEDRYIWNCDTGVDWESSDGKLEVTGNQLRFWESICTLSNPVNVRGLPKVTLYDAICEGEGTEWPTRILLHVTSNPPNHFLTVIDDRGEMSYQTCR